MALNLKMRIMKVIKKDHKIWTQNILRTEVDVEKKGNSINIGFFVSDDRIQKYFD